MISSDEVSAPIGMLSMGDFSSASLEQASIDFCSIEEPDLLVIGMGSVAKSAPGSLSCNFFKLRMIAH